MDVSKMSVNIILILLLCNLTSACEPTKDDDLAELVVGYLSGENSSVNSSTVITDWVSYDQIIEAATTAPTKATNPGADEAYWRRIGDTMYLTYTYKHTDSTGSAAGSGIYLFIIPNANHIDTSKVNISTDPQTGSVGTASVQANSNWSHGQVEVYNSTALVLNMQDPSVASNVIRLHSGFLPITGGIIAYSYQAAIPILGW